MRHRNAIEHANSFSPIKMLPSQVIMTSPCPIAPKAFANAHGKVNKQNLLLVVQMPNQWVTSASSGTMMMPINIAPIFVTNTFPAEMLHGPKTGKTPPHTHPHANALTLINTSKTNHGITSNESRVTNTNVKAFHPHFDFVPRQCPSLVFP